MSRGCLAGRPYPRDTRETQLSPSYPNSSHSNMCKSHGSLCRMLSRKLPTKTLQSSIAWVFTHSLSITQPLQSNPTINTRYKILNKITIKFDTELKPTKHIVINYNFTTLTQKKTKKQKNKNWVRRDRERNRRRRGQSSKVLWSDSYLFLKYDFWLVERNSERNQKNM